MSSSADRAQHLHLAIPDATTTLLELVIALERRTPALQGHAVRTRHGADLIARELRLPAAERNRLGWAAMLHDVGTIAVEGDAHSVHRHPVAGLKLVFPLRDFLGDWLSAIAEHHERWDGSGYPLGLAADQISLGGRIVAVAATWAETTSGRRPRERVRTGDSLAALRRQAGASFDPAVVQALLRAAGGRPEPTILRRWHQPHRAPDLVPDVGESP